MKNIIKLTTTKGESVLLNFNSVIYCQKTSNKNTSLQFNYSLGKENKPAYLVVLEDFETIENLLIESCK